MFTIKLIGVARQTPFFSQQITENVCGNICCGKFRPLIIPQTLNKPGKKGLLERKPGISILLNLLMRLLTTAFSNLRLQKSPRLKAIQ